MKFNRTGLGLSAVAVMFGVILLFQNCGSEPHSSESLPSVNIYHANAGPLDGVYRTVVWRCGSKDILSLMASIGATSVSYSINAESAAEGLTYSDGCQISGIMTLAFPSAGTLNLTLGATQCSSACPRTECTPTDAPSPALVMSYQYSQVQNYLTLTHTVTAEDLAAPTVYQMAGCALNSAVTLELSQ